MRVIAGKAKHLQLKTIEGNNTRPTTDRIKETLFNMLQNDIGGCTFLDLFSGSGGIGIEALSRGAEKAVFIEKNKNASECIKSNLRFTKLQDSGIVMEKDVFDAISMLEREGYLFNIIFMDPPYNLGLEKEVLEKLRNSAIIDEESIIIVEASIETEFDYISDYGYEIIKEKKYKTNKHIFLCKEFN